MTDQPKCQTCRWWREGYFVRGSSAAKKGATGEWRNGNGEFGECRLNPPHKASWVVTRGFEQTWRGDWCGEHQPKEASDDPEQEIETLVRVRNVLIAWQADLDDDDMFETVERDIAILDAMVVRAEIRLGHVLDA